MNRLSPGGDPDDLPPPPKINPTLYPKRNSLSGESDAMPPGIGSVAKSRSVGFSIDGGGEDGEASARSNVGSPRSVSGSGSGSLTGGFSKTTLTMMKSFNFKRKESDDASASDKVLYAKRAHQSFHSFPTRSSSLDPLMPTQQPFSIL